MGKKITKEMKNQKDKFINGSVTKGLKKNQAAFIFDLIDKYNITHFGGAPIVLNMITGAPDDDRKKLKNKVHVLTAGAPPPSIIFKKMK